MKDLDDLAMQLGGKAIGHRQPDGWWLCECGQRLETDLALFFHRRTVEHVDSDPSSSDTNAADQSRPLRPKS